MTRLPFYAAVASVTLAIYIVAVSVLLTTIIDALLTAAFSLTQL